MPWICKKCGEDIEYEFTKYYRIDKMGYKIIDGEFGRPFDEGRRYVCTGHDCDVEAEAGSGSYGGDRESLLKIAIWSDTPAHPFDHKYSPLRIAGG